MHALAGLIAAAAVVVAACEAKRSPTAEAPGLDGLRAHLEAVRRGDAAAAWQVPAADWPALVTAPYRAHYRDYAAGGAEVALAPGPIATRWQYADDRALAPAQRRERIALPVGRPGAIASIDGRDLTAVFVFDRGRWRALVGLDAITAGAIAARDAACAAAYTRAAEGTCMEAAAPAAIAALDGDRAQLAIACRRLTALACGSVGAPP